MKIYRFCVEKQDYDFVSKEFTNLKKAKHYLNTKKGDIALFYKLQNKLPKDKLITIELEKWVDIDCENVRVSVLERVQLI